MDSPPPIPAEPLPPPQKPRSQGLAAIVGGMAGALGGTLLAVAVFPAVKPLVDASNGWVFAGLSLLAAMVAIAVHEVGHVLGGWLVGYRFMLLVVGPVRLDRTEGRLRVVLNRSLAMAGGMALSVPTNRERLSRGYAVLLAGGPGLSFIGGLAGLVVAWLTPADAGLGVHIKLALGVFGFVSLLLGLVTLVPMPMGDAASDGLRLMRLVRGGPVAERDAALLRVVGQATLGERPSVWDRDAVLTALHPADGSSGDVTASYFALMHARDRGDGAEAKRHADRLMVVHKAAGKPLQAVALVELLTTAVLSGDAGGLRHTLNLLRPVRRFLMPAHREVVAAAELALAGDGVAAAERLRQPVVRAAYATPYLAELRDQMVESVQRATAARTPSG